MNNKSEPKNVEGTYLCPKCDNQLDINEKDIECFCIPPRVMQKLRNRVKLGKRRTKN